MAQYKERSHDTTLVRHLPLLQSKTFKHILLGDSIFERLTYEAANRTFYDSIKNDCVVLAVGGDKVENLLYRLENFDLLQHSPDAESVTIMIGTNNIEKAGVDAIYNLIEQAVTHVHTKLPLATVNLFGLLPRSSTVKRLSDAELLEKISTLNDKLRTMAGVTYCECPLPNEAENFVDHVHLSAAGYKYLTESLKLLIN